MKNTQWKSFWRFCSPSWRQDPATSLKMLPKTSSWSQRLPKYLSNTPQDSSQDHSKKAPTLKKTPKVMEGWSFLHFGDFCKDLAQNQEKWPRCLPKWSQFGRLGTKLAHLGANLALTWTVLDTTWPQLRPWWAHLGLNFARNFASILVLSPSWARQSPKGHQIQTWA